MFERIKDRYEKGFVTRAHLERYLNYGVITEEQYNEILAQ